MQLSTIILSILKEQRGRVATTVLFQMLGTYYVTHTNIRVPSQPEILHALDLLAEDGLIIKTHNGAWNEFQISNKGYAKLKAWYAPKKLASIMSNDFAKVLSIVATALSIFATYLSIKARY